MRKNEDIDLIIPQGAFLKSRARAIKKDNRKKRIRILKKILPTIAGLILLITILVLLLILNFKLKNHGIQGCLENGYSYAYCIEHS